MSSSQTILHPTDFSKHANHAFALACSVARASGSRLLVIHVAPIPQLYTKRGIHEELEAALRRRQASDPAVQVNWHLLAGEALSEILWLAQEIPCALIVMGTQGQTGLTRLLMGSVAEQVVRNAPCPVVTVKAPSRESLPAADGLSEAVLRTPATVPLRSILYPTDFSKRCEEAFRVACSLAKDHAARVIVVHVAESPMVGYGGVMTPPPPRPDYRRAAEEQLRQVQAPEPDARIERRLEEGNPAEEILRVAKEVNCDLIAMGTHGRTGLGRLLMGSVAEQVLRRAACPVLTVRPPLAASPSPATPVEEAVSVTGANKPTS